MRFTLTTIALGLLAAASAGSLPPTLVKRPASSSTPSPPQLPDPPNTEVVSFVDWKKMPTNFPIGFAILPDIVDPKDEDKTILSSSFAETIMWSTPSCLNLLQIPQGPTPNSAEFDGPGSSFAPPNMRGPTLRMQWNHTKIQEITMDQIQDRIQAPGNIARASLASDIIQNISRGVRSSVYLVLRPQQYQAFILSWAIGQWQPGHGPPQPNVNTPPDNQDYDDGMDSISPAPPDAIHPPSNEPNARTIDDFEKPDWEEDIDLGDVGDFETLCERAKCMAMSMVVNIMSP